MKTPITKQIADRLEELAVQWKDHTSQAEALMMAAKEVMTFQEKEKEQIMDAHSDGAYHTDWDENTDVIENAQDYYNETFNTKETCTCKSAQFTREVTEDFEPMCGRCGRPI